MAVVDIRLWLSTFHNQRHLAHQVGLMFSVALLVAGMIGVSIAVSANETQFVVVGQSEFGNFDDFDGARRRVTLAWSTAAVGGVSTAINTFINKWVHGSDQFDPKATDEQMAVRRTYIAVISCLTLTALSAGLFVLFFALARNGFGVLSALVFMTATMALVTTCYDTASVFRRERIELDEANAVLLTVDEFDA